MSGNRTNSTQGATNSGGTAGVTTKTSLHSSNDSGFANEPPPQPEVDYTDDEQSQMHGRMAHPIRYATVNGYFTCVTKIFMNFIFHISYFIYLITQQTKSNQTKPKKKQPHRYSFIDSLGLNGTAGYNNNEQFTLFTHQCLENALLSLFYIYSISNPITESLTPSFFLY